MQLGLKDFKRFEKQIILKNVTQNTGSSICFANYKCDALYNKPLLLYPWVFSFCSVIAHLDFSHIQEWNSGVYQRGIRV